MHHSHHCCIYQCYFRVCHDAYLKLFALQQSFQYISLCSLFFFSISDYEIDCLITIECNCYKFSLRILPWCLKTARILWLGKVCSAWRLGGLGLKGNYVVYTILFMFFPLLLTLFKLTDVHCFTLLGSGAHSPPTLKYFEKKMNIIFYVFVIFYPFMEGCFQGHCIYNTNLLSLKMITAFTIDECYSCAL